MEKMASAMSTSMSVKPLEKRQEAGIRRCGKAHVAHLLIIPLFRSFIIPV
jgi:hypothetical protein